MIKRLFRKLIERRIENAEKINANKLDKYGYAYLGVFKPDYEDDFMYTHTRAVFYTPKEENNLLNLRSLNSIIQHANNFVCIKVGRSFFKYNKFRKFDSIVDFLVYAINYNKEKYRTLVVIIDAIPTSIYADEDAVKQILNALGDNKNIIDYFNNTMQSKLNLIRKFNELSVAYNTKTMKELEQAYAEQFANKLN